MISLIAYCYSNQGKFFGLLLCSNLLVDLLARLIMLTGCKCTHENKISDMIVSGFADPALATNGRSRFSYETRQINFNRGIDNSIDPL
jgi:hypothetical protein